MMLGNAFGEPLTPTRSPVAGGEGARFLLPQVEGSPLQPPLPHAGEGWGEGRSFRRTAALASIVDRHGA